MNTERELLEKAFFAKFPAFSGDLTPGDTAIKRSWFEIFEAGWQAAKSSASTDAVLPELPEGEAIALNRVEDARDAARYRQIRRGQRWSVYDGIGDVLRSDALDAAIDKAMARKEGA